LAETEASPDVQRISRLPRRRALAVAVLCLVTFAFPLAGGATSAAAALWPGALAITLAFLLRDIYASLLLGALAGAVLVRGGDPFGAFLDLFSRYLLPALTDPWNVNVLVFTLLMGGLVEVLEQSGGMSAAAARLAGRSPDARRAGFVVYGLGWLFFVDGLASSVLVGKTLRPLADRARVSREKLAFLVDSTASPIAGLSLVSTWVAYELSLLRDGLESVGANADAAAPFLLLARSVPYRFYNLYMLAAVFFVVWLRRDLEPMRRAEREALRRPKEAGGEEPEPGLRVWPTLTVLVALVAGVVAGLWLDGGGLDRPLDASGVITAIGAADAAQVFVWATAGAGVLALLVVRMGDRAGGRRGSGDSVEAFLRGAAGLFLPASILVLAWTLSAVMKELGAAASLATLLEVGFPPALLPSVVFGLASAVSFATGTSWGTMAVVMPLAVPAAAALSGYSGGAAPPLFVATLGAVLAGAVFGDHCSPISDTTLVSAVATGCEPMAHVRTQLPYAIGSAGIAVVLGYLPAGIDAPPWLLLPAGIAACWCWIRFVAEPVPVAPASRVGSGAGRLGGG
jgi:Na+/H+ antiporter NhaC